MKKLTLNLDALTVEKFEVSGPHDARGTVVGADAFMSNPDVCFTPRCGDSVRVAC